jgi:ubiquinone/menaquinone biosynthesis C-methylase UbiE
MDILFDIHTGIPRGGPGNRESTRKAFSMLSDLPHTSIILDVGCGPGMQTLHLAECARGNIIALDNHQPFLTRLKQKTLDGNYDKQVLLTNASMFELPFKAHSFDCIWSEGAIYIIGFENGLKAWRQLLKPGGYMAVTELSWLKSNPPSEPLSFWASDYPGMHSISENLDLILTSGYQVLGHFILPITSWWDDYYTPLEKRLSILRVKYQDDPDANKSLDGTQKEIDLYRKYSDWYGYVFYVLKAL